MEYAYKMVGQLAAENSPNGNGPRRKSPLNKCGQRKFRVGPFVGLAQNGDELHFRGIPFQFLRWIWGELRNNTDQLWRTVQSKNGEEKYGKKQQK